MIKQYQNWILHLFGLSQIARTEEKVEAYVSVPSYTLITVLPYQPITAPVKLVFIMQDRSLIAEVYLYNSIGCSNGANICNSYVNFTCPADHLTDNVCYTCHYSCASCLYYD